MPVRWVLVLRSPQGDPEADPSRRLGGLPLALRLALDAQAAGASAIVVSVDSPRARAALVDRRLKIAVVDEAPDDVRRITVPAWWVVHRRLLPELAAATKDDPAGANRDLTAEPFALDVPYGFDPIEVRDRKSARRAEAALFCALRKPQDGWTSRWLNRYLSLAISRWLVRTPLTPNQVSVGILAVGIAGAVLAAFGTYWSLLAGAILFQAQSVLDGCDGEMSRVTHRGSLAGEWLDTIGDDLTNYGYFGAAAFGLYRTSGHVAYLLAGTVVVTCGVLVSAIEYRYLVKIGSGDLLKYPLSQGAGSGDGWFSAIQPLFKRDTFVLLTLIAAILGYVGAMLFLFAVAAFGILISVIGTEVRMARERREGP